MRPLSSLSAAFFLLAVAGFLLPGALTPLLLPADDRSRPSSLPLPSSAATGGNSAVGVGRRPLELPDSPSPPVVRGPASQSESLLVEFDGTVHFMDGRSGEPRWKLSTGSSLLYSERATPTGDGSDYYMYFNGLDLYEYSKSTGHRKLNMKIEDLVALTPMARDSIVTIGSKMTTLIIVDADTGNILYDSRESVVIPKIEEKPVPSVIETGITSNTTNYLTIIRMDYYLNSSELGVPRSGVMKSHVKAYMSSRPTLQPNISGELGSGSLVRKDISVLFMFPSPFGLQNALPLYGHDDKELSGLVLQDDVEKQNSLNLFLGARYAAFVVLLILIALCLKLREHAIFDGQMTDVRGKQSVVYKKRKARKAGNIRNSVVGNFHERHTSSKSENTEADGLSHIQSNEMGSFINFLKADDANDGRWVGRLFVSNSEIGRGSNGTVVLEGVYDGRPVAVKRLLRAHHDVAVKEIKNLIASDQHPNIVRWFGVEQDVDFVYISLERCACSLSDLIQLCSNPSSHSTVLKSSSSDTIDEYRIQVKRWKGLEKDIELWRENGLPSSQILKLIRDVVSGLAHLHELGILHRDLKPQNVLIIKDKFVSAKLSDMGISKRLLEDMSSLSRPATGSGSSGWQAPEQLLHGRQTRAVDLFSLGCLLFFCITKGKHPFGDHFERDSNIINNRVDLFLVDHIPEAVHLLSQLLDPDPKRRPTAVEVLHHPFFWSSEVRLSFLRDTSDRFELEDRENESNLLKSLENIAPVAFGGKWGEKLDSAFIADMGRYRKYKFDCVRDLLRVIRNRLNHYRELPKELQEILGSVPDGFDGYFSSRFPKLLIEVYKVVYEYCREEDSLSKYFKSSLF